MIDYSKYREALVDAYWKGQGVELSEGEKAEAAANAVGEAPPMSAMEEARAMYEAAKARSEAQSEVASPG